MSRTAGSGPDESGRRTDAGKQSRFQKLLAGPYFQAVVSASRAYLDVAVPDAVATECDYWALSCLPNTTRDVRRLSAVSIKTLETFVLYEDFEPAGNGAVAGFVVVRRSVLRQHWPTEKAFRRSFPGLTVRDSDYRDPGPDQCSVGGWYEDLLGALDDERFAAAARALAAPLLGSRTMHRRGHNYHLADQVLGRSAPPRE